jgi:hypothetical protein
MTEADPAVRNRLPLERWGRRLLDATRQRAADRRSTRWGLEFLMFGLKQGWACLFGGFMLALLLGSALFYPEGAALARYDFLVIGAVIIQAAMLLFRLESLEEAKVILAFHVAGTIMELFKVQAGSWLYPEPSLLRIGEVPLFSGFMYAAVGSYIARIWRIFDIRFRRTRRSGRPGCWPAPSTSTSSPTTGCRTFAGRCSRPRLCSSGAPPSSTRPTACGCPCRRCWASSWWPSSSGRRRTSAPGRERGCIPRRRSTAGARSPWPSSELVPADDHQRGAGLAGAQARGGRRGGDPRARPNRLIAVVRQAFLNPAAPSC